jgi:hypothetical protein
MDLPVKHVALGAGDYPVTIVVFTDDAVVQWAITVTGPCALPIAAVAKWVGRPVQVVTMPAHTFLERR